MVFLLICGFILNVFSDCDYVSIPILIYIPTISGVLINKLAFGLLLIVVAYVMICVYLYFIEEEGSNKKVSPEGGFLYFKERGFKDPDLKNAEKVYNYIPEL